MRDYYSSASRILKRGISVSRKLTVIAAVVKLVTRVADTAGKHGLAAIVSIAIIFAFYKLVDAMCTNLNLEQEITNYEKD